MPVNDADIAPIAVLLSAERLGRLTQLTGSARAAIELHQETLALGAALMNIIATVEIALRNAICENLSRHFGVPNWLVSPPAPFIWRSTERDKGSMALDSARRAEYAKMTHQEKAELDLIAYPHGRPAHLSHLARVQARRSHIRVTDGKIIAEITLHFWKRLYSPDYDHSLWRPSLKKTFPDKSVKRSDVADNLENIYQARNRIAHHEPVLHTRFSATVDSIRYIIERVEVPRAGPSTPLSNLLSEQIAALEQQSARLHARLAAYKRNP